MHSLRRTLAPLAAAALALGGCATHVTMPELPGCHPASPAASSAERARPSGVLSGAAPIPSAEPAVGDAAGPAGPDPHDHGPGHDGAGESGRPGHDPEDPGEAEPGHPGHGDPDDPGHGDPDDPDHGGAGGPDHGDPGDPDHGGAGDPDGRGVFR